MAHELDMSNGRANVVIFNANGQNDAWHKMGQVLTDGGNIDQWRVEAGLDWTAKKVPVKFNVNCAVHSMDDKCVIYREDTNAALGIVSPKYKIVQPGEILEFFRELVELGNFKMETAGSLFGGTKIWAQAKTGDNFKLKGVDEIKPYLLLGTSMDGSLATVGHFTTTRVVCNNTLRMAIGDSGQKAQVRITHLSDFNADQVKAQLGLADDSFQNFIEKATILANYKISRNDAIDFMAEQLKLEKDGDDEENGALSSSKELKQIIELFQGRAKGANLETSKGTAWGLVNAVTQFYDHEVGRRGDGSRAFDRGQFGDRAGFKVTIANRLLEAA